MNLQSFFKGKGKYYFLIGVLVVVYLIVTSVQMFSGYEVCFLYLALPLGFFVIFRLLRKDKKEG